MNTKHISPAITEYSLAQENAALREQVRVLREALDETEKCLIWAAQEALGRVSKEKVGGWIHHARKARGALETVPHE